MGEKTKISWSDSTANLWIGCTKVSPACDHCYAERDWDHRFGRVQWGPDGDRSEAKSGWELIEKFNREAAKNGGIDPELGRRRRIFVNSLSDIGDNHRSILWHAEAFALFDRSPCVDILLVTKRPKMLLKLIERHAPDWLRPGAWPAHVWVLVTVEDQERADERREAFRAIPAKVRGVSYEPALGPVDWTGWEFIQWLIAGGESGDKARTSDANWFRAALKWAGEHSIAFHFKQWGEWLPSGQFMNDYGRVTGGTATSEGRMRVHYRDASSNEVKILWPFKGVPTKANGEGVLCFKAGKDLAGNKLDGREWLEFPA